MIDWDFQRSAKALVETLNQIHVDSITSLLSSELTSWVVETRRDGGDGSVYLYHPPVLIFPNNKDHSHRVVESITSDEDEQLDSELDESAVLNNNSTVDFTEWSFSVVFHEVWRVPTLYFDVNGSDGTPINREEVVRLVSDDSMTEEQSWDFISQEEHPMTGSPSFFLHQCQTVAKMELLLLQEQHNLCPLLSWMSMILPSVGCSINPIVYNEAMKRMSSSRS
jgi:hypothetical protein